MCSAVVCIILALGFWPFHSPPNDVRWLKANNGVALGKHGTMLATDALSGGRSGTGSIEVWLQPDRRRVATLLSLYNPGRRVLFTLHQFSDDLLVKVRAARSRQFYVKDVFTFALQEKKPAFLTVTSGQHGTKVFLDGVLAIDVPDFSIPGDAFRGKPIVGDSPWQGDNFRGKILGVAIYDDELDAARVVDHYQSWTKDARPDFHAEECNIALYLFDEHGGNLIHNYAEMRSDLLIPERYMVEDKLAFEPFWEEFSLSANYWKGNLKNIVGFIPVGFCFYAYLVVAGPIRGVVLRTVVVGTLISILIEVGQAFLPTRDSGTTDIIMNTLGTWLGTVLYRRTYPFIVNRFPESSWLGTPQS